MKSRGFKVRRERGTCVRFFGLISGCETSTAKICNFFPSTCSRLYLSSLLFVFYRGRDASYFIAKNERYTEIKIHGGGKTPHLSFM